MKILHICLASHFTEGMTYQDNLLPEQNSLDGHETIIISDCFKYEGSKLVKTNEEDKVLNNGVRLIRLEYDLIINSLISSKVRKVDRLYNIILDLMPDIVLFHGVAGYEMLTVAKYKNKYPTTKLYIDSHEDFHNSGRSWLSKTLQYKLFNRLIVNTIKDKVDKFLYLSYESRNFLKQMYNIDDEKLEFYPLGGHIVEEDTKHEYSNEIRNIYGYTSKDILIVHSGKLSPGKRTKELIEAFSNVSNENLKLIIIGSIPPEQEKILLNLINKDRRINFVGWKDSKNLIKYLSAANLYFQPGTQSATMQNAICCGTPVALAPYPSHEPYVKGNGFYARSIEDYKNIFEEIAKNPIVLEQMSKKSYEIGRNILDYRILAKRLYK